MVSKIWVGSLVLGLSLSCAHRPPSGASDPSFSQFVDEFFDSQFAFHPVLATHAGLHQYDGQLDDLSRGRHQAEIAELKEFLLRLQPFDRSKLSFDDSIDAEALEGRIRGRLLELDVLRSWERNPMQYASLPGRSLQGLISRNFAPAPERLRSVIARLKAIPAVYQAARENIGAPPKEFTDLAIRMSKGAQGFFDRKLVQWARDAAGNDAALWAEFEAARRPVVTATVEFGQWLEKELLPRSTGAYALGEANFLAKLKYDEGVQLSLADLLSKGEAQLAKDYAAFVETAKKIDSTKSPAEVMKSLSDDHPSADDLIPFVGRSLEEVRRFVVEHGIVTVPSEVRPIVEETPPFARSGSFASMDTPGPFEQKATEAYYYVTPVEKDWDAKHKEEHLRLYNRYVVALIDIHEAFPGHYLQFLYAPRFPTKTRKLVHSSSNAEGWAHYTEQMVVDQGFGGGDPKIRLAQLQEALLRDCRYVVGVKLHTKGMTVEEGAQLMVEKAFQERANAYEEARRGAYNPTYLYYTLGKLEIQQLRDEYLAKRGGDLRGFHDAFVVQGALPIPLVRRILLR
jgi:uncharacterized protein (DUF885 family)